MAQKEATEARVDFAKARENYLHSLRLDLDDLDKKVAGLEAKEKTSTGKTRADLDSKLPPIRAQRDAFVRHMQEASNTSSAAWDSAKANLDQEWDSLKSAVDSAE